MTKEIGYRIQVAGIYSGKKVLSDLALCWIFVLAVDWVINMSVVSDVFSLLTNLILSIIWPSVLYINRISCTSLKSTYSCHALIKVHFFYAWILRVRGIEADTTHICQRHKLGAVMAGTGVHYQCNSWPPTDRHVKQWRAMKDGLHVRFAEWAVVKYSCFRVLVRVVWCELVNWLNITQTLRT
jgi:hypothetical protein